MYEYDDMYEYNDEDGGIQFQPYDDELINEYLIPKLEGKPRGEITTKDVYSKEPWLLDHPMGSFFKKNEWYYFVTRTQLSKKKIGCGQKAKRKITRDECSGFWKANATYDIKDKETNMTIGKRQTLAFIKSKVNNKRKQKMGDGSSCDVVVPGSENSWIMTEYMLPQIEDKFRELVICKIHVIENSNKKKKDDSSTSEQQPINIVDHGTSLAPYLEQQPMNIFDHGTLLAPYLEQHPTNVTCKIQENNKKDDLEAFIIPHHYEFLADSSAKQQPVNEAHRHVTEIPLIGSENNDQVFEASRQVSEKDEQLYVDAPIEEEGGEWMQGFINSLRTMNTSSMPMEKDVDTMIYDTSLVDWDLLDQYATLRPHESSELSESDQQ